MIVLTQLSFSVLSLAMIIDLTELWQLLTLALGLAGEEVKGASQHWKPQLCAPLVGQGWSARVAGEELPLHQSPCLPQARHWRGLWGGRACSGLRWWAQGGRGWGWTETQLPTWVCTFLSLRPGHLLMFYNKTQGIFQEYIKIERKKKNI